ncbi:hypothetical protein ACQ4PT_012608 [Festuca glaucescens]
MSWEDTAAGHSVSVLDAAVTDGGAFHARLPFEVVRRYVDARGGGRLPDQLLAALELRCAYCVGVGLAAPAPAVAPCAFCRGARVWRLPWRGHASSDATIQVPNDLAKCTSLRENTLVRLHIWDRLPMAEKVVIKAVLESNNLLPEFKSAHLAHQVGIVYLNMKFPVWRNKEKFGEFIVIGALPMEIIAIFSKGTKVHVRQGAKETEMGVQLHQPIFHPIVQNPPESEVVGLASMSHLVDHIAKKFTSSWNIEGPMRGKSSVVLYGPYQKEAIARGVASALNIRFESTSALQLITDYPDDSVAAVNKMFAGRGPSVLFIDRFDDAAPEAGRGYSRITDVIAAQLKLTFDKPTENSNFIIAGARWRSLVEPGINSRIRDILFSGPEEEQEGWDSAGNILRRLMTPPYDADNTRWSTPNVVLYGWNSSQMWNVASSFAACRSLNLVRVEASQLRMLYNRVGAVAVSDMFLRATCERPALLFIDRFDTVGDHPLIDELCLELDNLDRQVHVCIAVSSNDQGMTICAENLSKEKRVDEWHVRVTFLE